MISCPTETQDSFQKDPWSVKLVSSSHTYVEGFDRVVLPNLRRCLMWELTTWDKKPFVCWYNRWNPCLRVYLSCKFHGHVLMLKCLLFVVDTVDRTCVYGTIYLYVYLSHKFNGHTSLDVLRSFMPCGWPFAISSGGWSAWNNGPRWCLRSCDFTCLPLKFSISSLRPRSLHHSFGICHPLYHFTQLIFIWHLSS